MVISVSDGEGEGGRGFLLSHRTGYSSIIQ